MKKNLCLILAALLLCGALAGGGAGASVQPVGEVEFTSMFVKVEEVGFKWWIVYHRETKVMYAVSNSSHNVGTFTLLVNADGTPMLWRDNEKER